MAILSIVVAFFTFYAIYTILALSMNLEYGFGGLPNFGKVFFYSAGAYTAAALVSGLAGSNCWGGCGGTPVATRRVVPYFGRGGGQVAALDRISTVWRPC